MQVRSGGLLLSCRLQPEPEQCSSCSRRPLLRPPPCSARLLTPVNASRVRKTTLVCPPRPTLDSISRSHALVLFACKKNQLLSPDDTIVSIHLLSLEEDKGATPASSPAAANRSARHPPHRSSAALQLLPGSKQTLAAAMSALGITVKPTNVLRAFYFTVGAAAAAGAYAATRRSLWGGAAGVARAHGTLPPPAKQPDDPMFGARFRAWAAGKWNGAVDATLGELAKELAKRGL